MLEVAHAEAAVLFLDRDAVQAQLAHLGPQVAGECVGLVDLGGARRQPVGGPAGGGLADHVGVLAEAEFHRLRGEGDAHAVSSGPHGLSAGVL
jgi:hypothetical protein